MSKIKTFDDIEVRRPALATSYLHLLAAQPGRPIALFAPRRVGKTYFLDRDLTPAARQAGMLPVYADIWLNIEAPLEAINHALEEALDDVMVPATRTGRLAKTPVKGVGALGASVSLGDEPKRRDLPARPELRFDALVSRLAVLSSRTVLLMLDEIQSLGKTEAGTRTIGSLRAVLQKRKDQVRAVFTGSSQEELSAMTMTAGAPMYQFTQMLTFPYLDESFLQQLAAHFSEVHAAKRLDLHALEHAFAHIGFRPALMKDIVKSMSAEGIVDVDLGLRRFVESGPLVAAWKALFDDRDRLDQLTLIALAHRLAPTSKGTIDLLAQAGPPGVTLSKIRTALLRMKKERILSKPGADYVIDDPLFADYLLGLAPLQGIPLAKVRPAVKGSKASASKPASLPRSTGRK
jgi:hypothetical protein